jgi:hypothetical protein
MRNDPRAEIELIKQDSEESTVAGQRASARAVLSRSADEALTTRSREAISHSRDRLAGRPRSHAREKQFAELKQADAHIAQARLHIDRQRDLIQQLNGIGAPTDVAEGLLEAMQATLATMEDHRELIRKRLGI